MSKIFVDVYILNQALEALALAQLNGEAGLRDYEVLEIAESAVALEAALAQEQVEPLTEDQEQQMLKLCPHFGPSPARHEWMMGYKAAMMQKSSHGCGRCNDTTKPCDITNSNCASDYLDTQPAKQVSFDWPRKACPCRDVQQGDCLTFGCKWERDPSLVPQELRRQSKPAHEPVDGNTLLQKFLAAAKEAGVTHMHTKVIDTLRANLAQEQVYRACPTHCCPTHGCKYGHNNCPVVSGTVKPVYQRNNGCEDCADESNDIAKQLADALDSVQFYRRRCEALQSWQSKMRDPERTIVCDILANGKTLDQEFAGDRYTVPSKKKTVAWRFRSDPKRPWSLSDDEYFVSCKRDAGYIVEPLWCVPVS